MRSRAIVFVALVLVAVPLLAEAPRPRLGAHPGERHGRRHPPRVPAATPLERLDQAQPY